MPHYHLHLDECGTITPDPIGSHHADLAAASAVARTAALEIMGEELRAGHVCLGCHIDIVDPDGTHLARVDFADVLTVKGG